MPTHKSVSLKTSIGFDVCLAGRLETRFIPTISGLELIAAQIKRETLRNRKSQRSNVGGGEG